MTTSAPLIALQAIAHKRDGQELTADVIAAVVNGFTVGDIPDYQMSALAMAIYLRGMSVAETAALTESMLASGTSLRWPDSPPVVDKHSTGGVGDKVSLILAPLLACCGVWVPMISGRGLGPTGGTLDKLESIDGFQTQLELDEVQRITREVGCVIAGASSQLAPADRKLYALRDVTGTVASIPLITASIMSKKLAESLDALVLDVKYGSGAFMKSLSAAKELAQSLVDTGQRMGVKTSALLTSMQQPLGRMIGNAVEVQESLACLKGGGPPDVRQLTLQLGGRLLEKMHGDQDWERTLAQHLDSGRAYERFQQMVMSQKGDADFKLDIGQSHTIVAEQSGWVGTIQCEQLGWSVIALGGGRRQASDAIDHRVGLEMLVRVGEKVEAGQPILNVFADEQPDHTFCRQLMSSVGLVPEPVQADKLVVGSL